jgi:hypothetical protein
VLGPDRMSDTVVVSSFIHDFDLDWELASGEQRKRSDIRPNGFQQTHRTFLKRLALATSTLSTAALARSIFLSLLEQPVSFIHAIS